MSQRKIVPNSLIYTYLLIYVYYFYYFIILIKYIFYVFTYLFRTGSPRLLSSPTPNAPCLSLLNGVAGMLHNAVV